MRQIVQNLKTGELILENVPAPSGQPGKVLVQNRYSLISAGTERSTVHTGKLSLLGKAKKRPDLVKQVMANIRKEGLASTIHKVKNKLNWPKALGYSSCGIVLASDRQGLFQAGDLVACAGQDYASHAEVVCVPQNLTVKVPPGVSPEEACFTTVGAIALQGVRQADVRIGEKVCVIGLGLIGQLTAQILKANGCFVFGIDVSDHALKLAEDLGIQAAAHRKAAHLHQSLNAFAGPHGFDKVIVAASCQNNDPVLLAAEVLRKKGLMVVVGNVPVDIPREPHFYKKELELKMATSYGPGRYDPSYEEHGLDYPYPYVRFTENRNMEVFLHLIVQGMVQVKPLISHVFDFAEALKAYDVIMEQKEPYTGILLKYDENSRAVETRQVAVHHDPVKAINVGFIGAGSFAQGHLLPALKQYDVSLDTVVTTQGVSAKNVADKFGFRTASTEAEAVCSAKDINTVFIATRHNTHAGFVLRCLAARKHIFVEKPLCLTEDDLKEIASLGPGGRLFMVGYNRRFAPLSVYVKEHLPSDMRPVMMNFRVNAGYIPAESWIQDKEVGGGRILGELCHFVDLMLFFSGSVPRRVSAFGVTPRGKWQRDDNLVVQLEFQNGSVGQILYTAMGSSRMPKEHLEIFAGGSSFVIHDFREAKIFVQGRESNVRRPGKGHKEEIAAFISSLRDGTESPVPFEHILSVSLTTFKIIKSLETQSSQLVDIHE